MKFYTDLAQWWHLISPPEDYEEEALFFIEQLQEAIAKPSASLLELGSGGGNNALFI